MTRDSIERSLRSILVTILAIPAERVTAEARLIDDLGAESIDLLDLRFRIEDALGLKLSQSQLAEGLGTDGTAADFRARCTVGALAALLARHSGAEVA